MVVEKIISEGWILDEDWALKEKLKGVTVTDQGDRARKVGVWFDHPDKEIREQSYPYITLSLLEVSEALERVHRGHLWITQDWGNYPPPAWWNYEPLKPNQVGYLNEMTTPINLDYQITTWSRNPRHDRQMMSRIMTGGMVMLRGGWLEVPDGTIRRMDWLGHFKRDSVDENSKRLQSNVFRVRVSSEIPFRPVAYGRLGRVESIHFRFPPRNTPQYPYDPTPQPEDETMVITGEED